MENIIAKQNDEFRSHLGSQTFDLAIPGQFMFTSGITALPPVVQIDLWSLVRTYDAFGVDNDPHGEHDFGAISHPTAGRVFWKIDYYDPSLQGGSEDPADLARTHRVLTIMLASEY